MATNKKDFVHSFEDMVGVQAAPRASLAGFIDDDEEEGGLPLDPRLLSDKLWEGMPLYTARNTEPVKQLILNFKTWEDYAAFAKLVEFPLTKKTRSIFYPIKSTSELDLFRWVNADEDEDES